MSTFYHEAIPNVSGIYRITCTVTGKFYIGSAINLRHRRKSHFGDLQRGKHRNSKLQRAFNKYGPDAFTFDILELVLIPHLLTAREQYWFDTLQPFGERGFNIDRIAGSSLGRVMSQASREKSRTTQLGRPSVRMGWKPTLEQVERQRASLTGHKHTDEARRNMSASHVGTRRSPETREKMRVSALGHAPTNAKVYIVTSPDDMEYTVCNLRAFCKERGLSSGTLVQVAKGNRSHHKGWKARYP